MGAIYIILAIIIYFIPAIVAGKKQCFSGVLILNIFLGWTFLGWVGALIWAASGK